MQRLLTGFPLSLEWIRGLDLCTDEVAVPVWVMAPLFRYVRQASEQAARFLKRRHGLDVTPLRLSVHAGEDFVHLLSGLRRLDEAIDWLDFRPGDRIGHGLALGIDARTWAQRTGRIVMPAEERLFDLAWEWSWRSQQGGALTRNRHLLIEREIQELSERMFHERLQPLDVVMLVKDLHDEGRLRRAGFPNGLLAPFREEAAPSRRDPRQERVVRFLTSQTVFEQGQELVWVDPNMEMESLEELQRALRRKVGERELIIEVNPSSNLLIGHLADMGNHPLWRLQPQSAGDEIPPVAITIGSDDPITFATHLRQEYQHLYDALVLKGCSSEQADAWIEGIRKTSLAARFTVQWSRLRVEDFPAAATVDIALPP